MTFKTHNFCLVCNSSKLLKLKDFQSPQLCKCENCGFVFASQIPTLDELELHYESYGRNDYLSPITIQRYEELLDQFEPFRKTNKIIDVGCGIGYFLEVAKKRGWEVYGTEFTDTAIKICKNKNINIKKGVLNPINYTPETFDIITSFEVIEHINNPNQELEAFYALLRKGGLVYLTTPNFNSLLRYRLKSAYNIISYPEHLSYYSPKTIKKLFTSKSFKTLKIQTTGISLTRLKTSQGKSEQALISPISDDEVIRKKIESNKTLQLLKIFVNSFLSFIGKGDSLKACLVKHRYFASRLRQDF